MDDGMTRVSGQPMLHKYRFSESNGNSRESMDTWKFTPSPNSTMLVFVGVQNEGHGTAPSPSVTAVGQYPQVFSPVTNTTFIPAANPYGMQTFLYQAETGATVDFEHITVDPYPTTSKGYLAFWVVEITGETGLSLVHSSLATAGYGSLTSITSGALSGAATSGNVCIAFCATAVEANAGTAGLGAVSGWTRFGLHDTRYGSGNTTINGALYWRNNFTGTTMTVGDLGVGAKMAGLILTEWA
jgi:hypothetical protein